MEGGRGLHILIWEKSEVKKLIYVFSECIYYSVIYTISYKLMKNMTTRLTTRFPHYTKQTVSIIDRPSG